MKKKILSFVLALCLFVPGVAMLAACTQTNPPAHVHDYDSAWQNDDDYHWHACKDGDCDGVDGRAEHAWNDGVITTQETEGTKGIKTFTCTVCGKTKDEEYSNRMTSEEWTKAVTFEGISNYSVSTRSPSNAAFSNLIIVDGDKIYTEQVDMVVHRDDGYWSKDYLEKVGSGADAKYYAYRKTFNNYENWTRTEIEESDYLEVLPSAVFSMFSYEDCTYNPTTCKYEITMNMDGSTMAFTFGFLNGRLADVQLIDNGTTMNMTMSYAQNSVTIPTSYVNG